jgi:hypothetical protein
MKKRRDRWRAELWRTGPWYPIYKFGPWIPLIEWQPGDPDPVELVVTKIDVKRKTISVSSPKEKNETSKSRRRRV